MEASKVPVGFTRTTMVMDATPDTIRKIRIFITLETTARLVSVEPEPVASNR